MGSSRETKLPTIWQHATQLIAASKTGIRSEITTGRFPPVHCHQIADGTETWRSQYSHLGIAIAWPAGSANGMQGAAKNAQTYANTIAGTNNRIAKSKAERMKNFRGIDEDIGKTRKNGPNS